MTKVRDAWMLGLDLLAGVAVLIALGVGMAALRREHFRLQLEVLRSRGLPVYVVESELPPVSPTRMHEGKRAAEVARQRILQALAEPRG